MSPRESENIKIRLSAKEVFSDDENHSARNNASGFDTNPYSQDKKTFKRKVSAPYDHNGHSDYDFANK